MEGQLIKHRSPLIPDDYRSIAIVGRSRCGKTYQIPTLLSMLKKPDSIIVIATSTHQPIYEDIKKYAKSQDAVYKVFDKYTDETKDWFDDNKENLKSLDHNIVIIDDIVKKQQEELTWLFTTGRHSHLTVIILHQNFFEIPIPIRNNITDLVLFQSPQMGLVYRTISHCVQKEIYISLIEDLMNEDHSFIYVRIHTPGWDSKRLGRCTKNWNQVPVTE